MINDKQVTVRAKAFANEGVREHKVSVEADGTVRVYDSVAKHYTLNHALTDSAKIRIRKLAAEA